MEDLIDIKNLDFSSTKELKPITVTDLACANILENLKETIGAVDQKVYLRIWIKGGGCSGLQYGMIITPEKNEDDFEFPQNNISLIVDPASIHLLEGSTVDWDDSVFGGGFKILNPNSEGGCGCGSSFKNSAYKPKGIGGCGSCSLNKN